MTKTYNEVYELIEKIDSNHHQMMYDWTIRKNEPGVIELYAFNAHSTQMVALCN